MKENKFKVGDKVRIYITNDTGETYKSLGVVKELADRDDRMCVDEDGTMRMVWRQQCRRLVPKKKQPADEIWIRPDFIELIKRGEVYAALTGPHGELLNECGWIKYKRCK